MLFVGDNTSAITSVISEMFPETAYQRRAVRFYYNVLVMGPGPKRAEMLKAAHAWASMDAIAEKTGAVTQPSWTL